MTDLLTLARQRGTDRQYLDWLRTQPSALDGTWSAWNMDIGRWENVPAHYRTAANSGTGTKPEYSAIPLTREQHDLQHRIGTFAFMPRDWWEEQCELHLNRWIDS